MPQRQKRSQIRLPNLKRLTRNSQPLTDFLNNSHESANWVIGFGNGSPYDEEVCASFYRFCWRDDPLLVVSFCPRRSDSGDDNDEIFAATFLYALNFVA